MVILRDDLNRPVQISRLPVRRIVTLAPSATENLWAIGAGKTVVGVTTADDYPAQVANLPRIGDFYKPLTERIRALKPELVIVDSATLSVEAMNDLQTRLHLPVWAQKSDSYASITRHLTQLGKLTGQPAGAGKAAHVLASAQKAAQSRAKNRAAKPSVFIQIDNSALYAAGPHTFLDDLIRLAGGANAVKGVNPFPLVSKETLLFSNPHLFLLTAPLPQGTLSRPAPPSALDPALRALPAVKAGRAFLINADLVSRPTPRVAQGLLEMARLLSL